MAGEHSAELVSDAVNSLPDDISHDRARIRIRHAPSDRATHKPTDPKHDPENGCPGRKHKSYLKEDEAFNRYLGERAIQFSVVKKQISTPKTQRCRLAHVHAGQWFGETLIADDALRARLTVIQQAAHRGVVPNSPPS